MISERITTPEHPLYAEAIDLYVYGDGDLYEPPPFT